MFNKLLGILMLMAIAICSMGCTTGENRAGKDAAQARYEKETDVALDELRNDAITLEEYEAREESARARRDAAMDRYKQEETDWTQTIVSVVSGLLGLGGIVVAGRAKGQATATKASVSTIVNRTHEIAAEIAAQRRSLQETDDWVQENEKKIDQIAVNTAFSPGGGGPPQRLAPHVPVITPPDPVRGDVPPVIDPQPLPPVMHTRP